jgi:prepilin-type N-terminal cleavage/methylation domain-containing protein
MNRSNSSGFTIIELIIVVMIVGLLAALAIPSYQKSVETSYAEDAIATLQIVGTTNRLYNLDHGNGGYAAGLLNSCTNSPTSCGTSGANPCDFINCGYMALANFSGAQYNFYAANAGASGTDPCGLSSGYYAGCAKRIACSGPVVKNCSRSTTYQNWGYTVDINGVIAAYNGAPDASSVQ